jgi:arylsulfatase A-like enzyme
MTGTAGAKSPHEYYFYYDQGRLEGVRGGKWKLHRLKKDKWCLYDLESDIGEQVDVSRKHPEIVAKLEQYLERARKELGDERTGQMGQGVRPLGKIDKSKRPT